MVECMTLDHGGGGVCGGGGPTTLSKTTPH